jgi:pyrimidine-nucleoside phosphorylase
MVDDPKRLPRAPQVVTLRATRGAFVAAIDAEQVGLASVHLGAGREKKGDPIDHRTGVVLHAKVGDRVERGQPFADVHVAGRPADAAAVDQIRTAFRWSARRVPRRKLILGRIGGH